MTDETHPYGRWRPWHPREVMAFFAALRAPWWIAGGWAIDLFLGRQTREHEDCDVLVLRRDQHQTREHEDCDVLVLRRDQHAIRALFGAWDVQAALPPPRDETWPFRPWALDEALDLAIHDIWLRPAATAPWAFQLMIADTDDGQWQFRRMPAIGRPIVTIGGITAEGILYLAPEIQLLHKAKGLRPKDEADFTQTLPALDQERREWLRNALTMAHPNHPWLKQLAENEEHTSHVSQRKGGY